jgi:hypothetical protein
MKKLLLPLVLLIVGCNPSSEDTSYSRCSLNDSPKGSENLLTQACDDLIDDLINEQNTNKILACNGSYCPLFLSFDEEIEYIKLYETKEDIFDKSTYLTWKESGWWKTSSWDLNTVTWYGYAVNDELPYRSFNRETLELEIEDITVRSKLYGNRFELENKTYEWTCSCQLIKKGDLKNLITNTLKSEKQRKLKELLEQEEKLDSAKERRKL